MSPRPELTHRERVRLALAHRETDRIPIAMVCSGINPPARRALEAHLRRERGITVDQYLAPLLDIAGVAPVYVGPPLPAGQDIWGVRRRPVSYGDGAYDEIDHYPLAAASLDDLVRYPWPRTEWFDYGSLLDRVRAANAGGERCLMVANGNVFETAWYMRGFARLFEDFVLDPEFAHALLDRVADFWVEHFRRLLAAADGAVDLAFTADDLGGQEGLLMSRALWEELVKPRHVRLNRAIHEFGAAVIYHTDGAVMEVVDGLVEMGIDVLQALQFSARGMDPVALKEGFGGQLCFEGGISVQTTLPCGTPEEVRREVRERIDVLGRGGGYILGPSHAIQAGTPPENILALFDTAAGYYPFSQRA
ncbi:MAG: uroporphyrinogen decarboxylase family protein [Gemmatimonadota bacterium]